MVRAYTGRLRCAITERGRGIQPVSHEGGSPTLAQLPRQFADEVGKKQQDEVVRMESSRVLSGFCPTASCPPLAADFVEVGVERCLVSAPRRWIPATVCSRFW